MKIPAINLAGIQYLFGFTPQSTYVQASDKVCYCQVGQITRGPYHVSSKLFVILLLAISWVVKRLTRKVHHYFRSRGVVKNACNFTVTPLIFFVALVAKVYCVQNDEMLFQRQIKIIKYLSLMAPMKISSTEKNQNFTLL
jgi:hypothetical protein